MFFLYDDPYKCFLSKKQPSLTYNAFAQMVITCFVESHVQPTWSPQTTGSTTPASLLSVYGTWHKGIAPTSWEHV